MGLTVKFVDIRDKYFTQTDLRCEVLTDVNHYNSGNKICLCRVGWSNWGWGEDGWLDSSLFIASKGIGDYIRPGRHSMKDYTTLLSVCFKASELPKGGEDYYQFCYFTKNNQLLGVSKHVQFTTPKHTLESSVEERLTVTDNNLNTMSNDLFELKTTVGKLTDLLSAKTTEDMTQLMACRVESKTKSERINALALSLEEIKKLKNHCESRVESLERDVKALRDENKSLKSREYKGLDSSQSRVQEVIVHNRETAIQAIDELYKKLSETTQKTIVEEWKAREEMFMKEINEIKDQLTITSEEYQKIYNKNKALEDRIKEMKIKVKYYFEFKDLFVREETEVKSIIGSELGVEVLDSESVVSDNTSIATVSEDQELEETVSDGKVYSFSPNV